MIKENKNSQIEESIKEIQKILSSISPLEGMANIYSDMAQISGLRSLNATVTQQHLNILGTAIVAAGANRILGTDSTEKGVKLSPTEYLDCLHKLVALTIATEEKRTAKVPEDKTTVAPKTTSVN